MKILSHATYIGTSGYNSHCQNFFKALNKTHEVKIRNFTISKNWKGLQASDPHDGDADELDRDLIVQQSLWENNILKDFDIYAGLKDYTHDVNIVLAEVNHQYFFHNYSGPKIAYTVWESTIYPELFFNKLKEYDQVWVPSKWQAEITAKQGIESNKIKIIPEGVNTSLFYPEDLKYEDDKFRFLIFGRWDDRKSIRELIEAFKNVFGESEKVELVISADNPQSVDGMKSTEERLKFYNINFNNIKILHFPNKEDYAKYLKRGHVFLSCARSEGWNLPLIEAMACGIPSLYSNCSGQLEFAQGKGIPVDVKGTATSLYVNCYSKNQLPGNWYDPDFKDLESKILEVYNNYNFYKDAALKDSVLIRNEFTWDNAAKKADQAIKELFKNRKFTINYLGQSENGLSVYYNSNTDHDVKINAKIIDEYTGFVFYDYTFFINNKCNFHTSHAYSLPNQIFRIYDFETKELLLEKKTNVNDTVDVKKLKTENKNLIEQIPDNFKTHSGLGFSFFEIYNRQTYSFKNCKIEKGDIVFDLGSFMGLFSRYAFQIGSSEVHAFEPNKELENVFVNLNKGFNYFYSNKAVYSKPISFQKSEDLHASKVVEGGSSGSNINLNDYIKEKNVTKIDYLKVDVEGSEYDLFETLDENFLCNNVKKIAIEYHFNSDNRITKILNKLKKLGFIYEFESEAGVLKELGMLYAWKTLEFSGVKENELKLNDNKQSIVVESELIKENFAFVTCGDSIYLSTIENLIKSLLEFSKSKIIIYGIDCDVPFDYPNIIKRRLDPKKYSKYDKWYWKQMVCIESLSENFSNFVWIDGDTIVNYNIDSIERYFSQIENYPISDIHRTGIEHFFHCETDGVMESQFFNQNLTSLFGVTRSQPYMHICFFIYNNACDWWFKEIINTYKSIDLNNYMKYLPWNDEGIDNVLRWKFGFKKHLPLSNFDVSSYDGDNGVTTNQLKDFYAFWHHSGPFNFNRVFGFQYISKNKSDIIYFHGNKNPKLWSEMFDFIKMKKDNSFYKSEKFFTSKYELKNLGSIKEIEGSTLNVAEKFGWDYAIYHEIYNLRDYYWNREKKINEGDIVVDLGGNIGIFNRWAYQQGAEKVISFEPDRRYFELLKKNSDPKSILFNSAVNDKIGEVQLFESSHLGGSNILFEDSNSNKYNVKSYTLDHLFDSNLIQKIDFLKIDVEGSEHLVFQGISDENLKKVKFIAMEYHHCNFNYDEALRNTLMSRLINCGFTNNILWCGNNQALQLIYSYR